jgi:hypothetical protein
VIPAKAGIQDHVTRLDPGVCPGLDPGFARVTGKKVSCGMIIALMSKNLVFTVS